MRRLSLGFVVLVLLQLGVSAPQSSADPKRSSPASKGSKPKGSFSSVATPQALGDQIVQFFGHKTGKELMMEKSGNVTGAGAAASQVFSGKPSGRTSKATSVKSDYVPPPPVPRASVPQIRQEIQQILELNKKIKNVQSGRSGQLQRVQEQARIHQKILNELEASQKQADGQKSSSKNSLLAQEKLRIIHEETQRNAQMMDDLKEAPAGASKVAMDEKKVKPRAVSGTAEKVKFVAS